MWFAKRLSASQLTQLVDATCMAEVWTLTDPPVGTDAPSEQNSTNWCVIVDQAERTVGNRSPTLRQFLMLAIFQELVLLSRAMTACHIAASRVLKHESRVDFLRLLQSAIQDRPALSDPLRTDFMRAASSLGTPHLPVVEVGEAAVESVAAYGQLYAEVSKVAGQDAGRTLLTQSLRLADHVRRLATVVLDEQSPVEPQVALAMNIGAAMTASAAYAQSAVSSVIRGDALKLLRHSPLRASD